jgi:hypothetical protein
MEKTAARVGGGQDVIRRHVQRAIRERMTDTFDGAPTFVQHSAPVVLDADVAIYDAELNAAGSSGASLTLARHGGANASDVFGVSGNLAFSDGHALLSGVDIGSVTNANGENGHHLQCQRDRSARQRGDARHHL